MNNGPAILSIIMPVRNEDVNLRIMIPLLEAGIETPHEVLVIYDFPEDKSVAIVKKLQAKYPNVKLVLNDYGRGVPNAIKKGVDVSQSDVIFIMAIDELFSTPIIDNMFRLIESGCDFVSTTRYVRGAKDVRSSVIEGILSRSANRLFRMITGSVLTDATTGIKMMRKSVFDKITIEARPVGWAFAFELSIKAQLSGLRIGEIPVISVDRLFGGKSTFKIAPWTMEYLRWFLWGIRRLNRLNRRQKKAITLTGLRGS